MPGFFTIPERFPGSGGFILRVKEAPFCAEDPSLLDVPNRSVTPGLPDGVHDSSVYQGGYPGRHRYREVHLPEGYREAYWAIYTLYIPTMVYTGLYTPRTYPPWETYWAIHTPVHTHHGRHIGRHTTYKRAYREAYGREGDLCAKRL